MFLSVEALRAQNSELASISPIIEDLEYALIHGYLKEANPGMLKQIFEDPYSQELNALEVFYSELITPAVLSKDQKIQATEVRAQLRDLSQNYYISVADVISYIPILSSILDGLNHEYSEVLLPLELRQINVIKLDLNEEQVRFLKLTIKESDISEAIGTLSHAEIFTENARSILKVIGYVHEYTAKLDEESSLLSRLIYMADMDAQERKNLPRFGLKMQQHVKALVKFIDSLEP